MDRELFAKTRMGILKNLCADLPSFKFSSLALPCPCPVSPYPTAYAWGYAPALHFHVQLIDKFKLSRCSRVLYGEGICGGPRVGTWSWHALSPKISWCANHVRSTDVERLFRRVKCCSSTSCITSTKHVRWRIDSLKPSLDREGGNDEYEHVDKSPGAGNPSIHLVVSSRVDSAQPKALLTHILLWNKNTDNKPTMLPAMTASSPAITR